MCVQSVILPVQVSGQNFLFYFIWNGGPDWETCQYCDFFMLSISLVPRSSLFNSCSMQINWKADSQYTVTCMVEHSID